MAEAELNALKKLESNKSCANCDAYNKFGHGNVCEKFKTFVCSNCKSSHQSFSHRVKSVTMSNWSKDDVDALKDENGGGNAAAKRVWLGRWDESKLRKPKEGDHVDVYKRFIDKVYNDRAFYDENAAANPSASSSGAAGASSSRGSRRRVTEDAPASSSSSSAAAPNLLDFGSPTASASSSSFAPTFDAFASPPKSNGASDGWGAFASAPATGSNDGFGAFTSAPAPQAAAAPAPFAASFDAFGAPSTPAPTSQPVASFDPFAPSAGAASSNGFGAFGGSQAQSQPASSSHFGFGASSHAAPSPPMMAPPPPMMAPSSQNFSAFDTLAAPPPNMGMGGLGPRGPMPGGMGMGMNMGMGMGMGMAPPMQQQPRGMMMGGGYGGAAPPQMMMQGGGGFNGHSMPQAAAYGGVRPVGQGGSRDPFAGLGLPGK